MPTAEAPRVTKRKLTLSEAADQWERCQREMDRLKPIREEAAEVLVAHFEKTGRSTYKDRIALVVTPGRLVLDQAKIRAFLGAQLSKYQKRSSESRSLRLLQK
jgi:hypothetical protein